MVESRILFSLNPPGITIFEDNSKTNSFRWSKELTEEEARRLLVKAKLVDSRRVKSIREFVVFAPMADFDLASILEQADLVCTTNSCVCDCCKDGLAGPFRPCQNLKDDAVLLCACIEDKAFCA